MDQLKKLREKKAQMGKMHPMEQKAKMGVVSDLQKMAEEAMGDRLKGMGKVTVASDSPEGLEHGLEHAHDIIKHLPEALDDSHPDHENFAHSERSEDGEDGDSDFPDADDDHELESDPEAEHEHDEEEEGGHEMHKMAHGGEMPDYDNMDDGELDRHLQHLVELKRKKGMR